MESFSISTATQAIFGPGTRVQLLAHVRSNSPAHVLLIASSNSIKRRMVKELIDSLRGVSLVHLWDQVLPNPRVSDVDKCLEVHRNSGITHVIGIGGGSALDQAKATAMALDTGLPVSKLLAIEGGMPERSNKLILLPTTSGTGAEMSYGAILTDANSGEKLGLRGLKLAADLTLVDPEMCHSVPSKDTMITGFDVLTHALETYISSEATPYTTDLSRGALSRVFRYLPQLSQDLNNPNARSEMAYASMIMGVNLALSTTSLPHRLQYPIGAATDTAHAAGLAALYPAWLHFLLPHAEDKLANCAEWIGVSDSQASVGGNARRFAQAVLDLLVQIDLTPSLQDLGVTEEMINRFAHEVTGKLETDPSYSSRTDLTAVYSRAWSGKGL